ncbi:MAG UNVERIFIED_CONTAM: hypothetical protein LVT10_02275 [Anaerolineae bacterium]
MPTNSEREELAQFLAPANFAAPTRYPPSTINGCARRRPARGCGAKVEPTRPATTPITAQGRFLLVGTFIWVVCMVTLLATRLEGWHDLR